MIVSVDTETATDDQIRAAIEALEAALANRVQPNPPASRLAVEIVRIGAVCYQFELVKCGKLCRCMNGPCHGPYWYSYQRAVAGGKAKTVSRYIGKYAPVPVIAWLESHGRPTEGYARV